MEKLWAGRTETETAKLADAFNSSIAVDGRMYKEDITGSMAHAALLVGYNCIEIDILHAFKDIVLYKWILRF